MSFDESLGMAALAGLEEMGREATDGRAVVVNGSAVLAVVEPGGGTDVRDGGGAVPGADCRVTISADDAARYAVKVGSAIEVPGMPRPRMQVVAMRAAGAGAVMMLYCAGSGAGRGMDW